MTDADLVAAVRRGERHAIARAITLVESSRRDHRRRAEAVLDEVLKAPADSVRIGITGVPGVGKSTFIESFGNYLIAQGHRVAVLSIDPSSALSGGSILGDKTRMETLSRHADAYIRPSPSAGTLGGVARRTRESVLILESAGYDVVVVETVGVGQSETLVAEMTDIFLLLLLPGAGDELQGIKRGIMELADIVLVNKADDDLLASAGRAVAEYENAMRLMQRRYREWLVPVQTCSARDGDGIESAWKKIEEFMLMSRAHGYFGRRRDQQQIHWFRQELNDGLLERMHADTRLGAAVRTAELDVLAHRATAAGAARRVINYLFENEPS